MHFFLTCFAEIGLWSHGRSIQIISLSLSHAAMEASASSNMKLILNCCIFIGTLDGVYMEIRQEVGSDNICLFGAQAQEIVGLRKERDEARYTCSPCFYHGMCTSKIQ